MRKLTAVLRNYKKELKKYCSKKLKSGDKSAASVWVCDNYHSCSGCLKAAIGYLKRENAGYLMPLFNSCVDFLSVPQEVSQDRIVKKFSSQQLSVRECEALSTLLFAASAAVVCENTDNEELVISAVKNQNKLKEIDFSALFYDISKVERYLYDDPSGDYYKMNDETRRLYRFAVSLGAEKQGISENDFAKKALEQAKNEEDGKNHIGFFLPLRNNNRKKGRYFFIFEAVLSILLSVFLGLAATKKLYSVFLLALPVFSLIKPLSDRFSSLLFPPVKLFSLDEEAEIGKDRETLITVSSLLPPAAKTENLGKRLSEVYSSNSKGRVRLMLLCDLKNNSLPENPCDETDISAAKRLIDSLNKKHSGGFILAVRDRVYSQGENEYTGYERKRGALCSLFKFLRDGNEDSFRVLYGDKAELSNVKYVMALDSDTSLSFEVLRKLTAIASHPLNRPNIDLASRTVKSGYGIIVPRIETSLASAQKTVFSRIFTNGGCLSYSPAVHEKYMDAFGESIFTGKGLIDVDAFNCVVGERFEEQRILSHDILEGALLKTAFSSSCELTDSFPSNARGYFSRLHRWIRGDVQNLKYIFFPLSSEVGAPVLPALAKYQLADNFRRAVTPLISLLLIILSCFTSAYGSALFLAVGALSASGENLVAFILSVIKSGMKSFYGLYFSSEISTANKDFLRFFIALGSLPQTVFVSCDAVIRASVRSLFTHKRLLCWTTAAQADSLSEKRLFSTLFFPCSAFVVLFVFGNIFHRFISLIILLYIPISLSDGIKLHSHTQRPPTESERQTISSFASAAWRYFEENVTQADNFLPPDNVQETPTPRIAHRTSPTNIGLYLVSALAAADFAFISASEMFSRIKKTLDTIDMLPKYEGLLYNWYDTRKADVLSPAYVSTVDCGNYLVCLTALKEGLKEYAYFDAGFSSLITRIDIILEKSDLSPLYDVRRNLFRIGLDTESGEASTSFYDLYMSEARMTSYYETARRHVSVRHWQSLDRTLKRNGRYVTAASWTGAMFEFFMPSLFLKVEENSFQAEGLDVCLYVQKKWVKKRHIPFGTSESCFYDVDSSLNYRYKAHGIRALALKRNADEENVISPYSTFLIMPFDRKAAMKNLARLSALHCEGRCGFYEAVDFTPSRLEGEEYAVVRAYMAHHVGMGIIAMANALMDNIFVRRFMRDADMCSAEILLKEKVPAHSVGVDSLREPDTFERPRRPEKNFGRNFAGENRDVYAYSNGELTLICDRFGRNRTLYAGAEIYKFSKRSAGISVGVKNDGEIITLVGKNDEGISLKKYALTAEKNKKGLKMQSAVMVHPSEPALLIPVKITNLSESEIEADIFWYIEPLLLELEKENMHPAFSDMFLRINKLENIKAFLCSRVNSDSSPAMAVGFYGKNSFYAGVDREDILSRKIDAESVFDMGFKIKNRGSPGVSPALAIGSKMRLKKGKSGEYVLIIALAGTLNEAKHRFLSVKGGFLPAVSKGLAAPFLRDALTFAGVCDFLSCVFFGADVKGMAACAAGSVKASAECLWQFGISGDLPLITVFAQKNCSPSMQRAFVKLYRRLSRSGIKVDMVFIFGRNTDYSFSGEQSLFQALRDEGVSDNVGKNAGIHILSINKLSGESLTEILAFSYLIFPEEKEKILPEQPFNLPVIPAEKFSDGENGFVDGGYAIYKHPSLPWSHTLSNISFGTLLTDRSLGFSWALNSRQNKLSEWSNDTSRDIEGERLFVKIKNKIYDCINETTVYFRDCSAEYRGICGGLKVKTLVSVPDKGMRKRISVCLENNSEKPMSVQLFYCVFPVMGENNKYRRFLKYRVKDTGVTVSNPVNRDFLGFMRVSSPDSGAFPVLNTEEFAGIKRKCAGILQKVVVNKDCIIKMDFDMRFARKEKALDALPLPPFSPKEKTKIKVRTFSLGLNEFASSLLYHQIRDTRLFAKTGFYQCSGAYGFRDQLQDVIPLINRDNKTVRRIILKMASAQFSEGDVLHWFHPVFNDKLIYKGVRTLCSDDKLWLPYVAADYVLKTGDTDILNKQLPFLGGDILPPGAREEYNKFEHLSRRASLYTHCLYAITASLKTGGRHLPLIGGGDWNDSFGAVGENGAGESVWLAMFLRLVCIKFSKVCELTKDIKMKKRLLSVSQDMAEAIDKYAWNGKWYIRGFYDDGSTLGNMGDKECEIDLLCQAWSALSNMPDANKRKTALLSAYERLFDEKNGVVKLFSPPFSLNGKRTGYVNFYPPGIRENGGQYTHAAIWFAIALFRESMFEEGEKVLTSLLPNVKYRSKRGDVYKVEPYALCGDVYSAKELEGRGGWSLYTGSAGWMLTLADELDGKILPENESQSEKNQMD